MKRIFTFLIPMVLGIVITLNVFMPLQAKAQSPEKMSYQAVIRNSSDELVTNTQVGMQISILQSTADGSAVYVETQTPTTNANGLISIEIGTGTTSDDFTTIDWSNGPYFIQTETDPQGGTDYTITGTSQLLSVPYALHAKTAETVTGTITETDPVFSDWDKSTGISITETQISDLGTYIETETDPVFDASIASGITANDTAKWNDASVGSYTETDPVFSDWDKSTGISITESQITDLQSYLTTETDPVFSDWDKSTGILIAESQISDLGSYLETETDPAVAANFDFTGAANGDLLQFDGSKYVKFTPDYISDYTVTETDVTTHQGALQITESQITDLQSYLTAETDPIFSNWDKSAGILITESQISDLGSYLEAETDPVYTAKFDLTSVADGDLLKYNNTTGKFEKFTPDYATGSHTHTDATTSASGFMSSADKTKLDGIAEGAEVNMQADWNQTTTTADDYIKNKPTIPAVADGSETKVTAGTNVTVTGTGTTANPYVVNATGSGERYLGEEYLDGIIFYLYIGSDGQQHGLVVSKTESTAKWQNTGVLVNADRTEDGNYNTSLMTDSPAKTWVTSLGTDWYLPSVDELSLLWHNRFHVNKTARDIGSTLLSTTAFYWSSTERSAAGAFYFYFSSGSANDLGKTNTYRVRAVRAF